VCSVTRRTLIGWRGCWFQKAPVVVVGFAQSTGVTAGLAPRSSSGRFILAAPRKRNRRGAGPAGRTSRQGGTGYLTVRMPFIPPAAWPGTLHMYSYLPAVSVTFSVAVPLVIVGVLLPLHELPVPPLLLEHSVKL